MDWTRYLTDGFMPHGYCLRWDVPLLTVFILGNAGIALAYFIIPAVLRHFVRERADLPYPHMFRLFAAFILSCGLTHVAKIWTLYQPAYWVEAVLDLWTAGVSLATGVLLIPLIPKALKLRSPIELDALNQKLQAAAAEMQAAQGALELAVEQRTVELMAVTAKAQAAEKFYRELFDLMPQLGWTARPDGFIDFYNRGWYEYTGTTYEQMQGWGWESVHDPDILPAVKEKWTEALRSGSVFEMNFPLKGRDGKFRWFLTRVNPIRDDKGEIIRWVGINTNIQEQVEQAETLEHLVQERTAELKGANEELQRASRAKDAFLASMSHELRTPLNSILGFSGILLMELPGPLNEVQQEQLQNVEKSARHLLSLINDMLDLAKVESGKLQLNVQAVELEPIIASVLSTMQPLCREKGLTLNYNPSPFVVLADERALRQIITNLVSNAVKFTAEGSVTVDVERGAEDVLVKVSDTGTGIKSEDLARLFQEYVQLHPEQAAQGTGLGLMLTQRLAHLMDGRVTVRSEYGKGSIFTLYLKQKR